MKTSKFERINNLIFAWVFAIISGFCFLGFILGHNFHLFTFLVTALLSVIFFSSAKNNRSCSNQAQ